MFINFIETKIKKCITRNRKGYKKCSDAACTIFLILRRIRIPRDICKLIGNYIYKPKFGAANPEKIDLSQKIFLLSIRNG